MSAPASPGEDENSIPVIGPAGGTASVNLAAQKIGGPVGFLKLLGPGLITGASDDDPSGIGTYAIAGASFGFATLWMALVTFPMMASVQYICAKISMVSGRGLAGVLRTYYPRSLVFLTVLALAVANTLNAGADIGAIAAGMQLLAPVRPSYLIVLIALAIIALQWWGSYRLIANIFKWLTFVLFAYVLSAFFCRPDWPAVLRGTLLPSIHWDRHFLSVTVAILGTTISPYMFFWQASQEVEEEIAVGRKTVAQRRGATRAELRAAALDVNAGMLLSNLVMYFVILSTAATLFKAGKTNIDTAADAALALRPLAGKAAEALLALGLIGTGFLAVPILIGSTAYAAGEAFGWRYGFDKRPRQARAFYGLIAALTLAGMMVNFVGINPVKALFLSAVINGFLAPPLLILVMLVSGNSTIMGKRANKKSLAVAGWLTALVMSAAAIALVFSGP